MYVYIVYNILYLLQTLPVVISSALIDPTMFLCEVYKKVLSDW